MPVAKTRTSPWQERARPLLGKMSDTKIAKEISTAAVPVTRSQIGDLRRSLGIQPSPEAAARAAFFRPKPHKPSKAEPNPGLALVSDDARAWPPATPDELLVSLVDSVAVIDPNDNGVTRATIVNAMKYTKYSVVDTLRAVNACVRHGIFARKGGKVRLG